MTELCGEEAEVDVDHPPAAQARPRSFQPSWREVVRIAQGDLAEDFDVVGVVELPGRPVPVKRTWRGHERVRHQSHDSESALSRRS